MTSRSSGHAGTRSHLWRATHVAALTTLALGLAWPTGLATSTHVEAKTPGKTYCYHRTCHRVMTLEETQRAIGKPMTLHASHYDDPWKDRFNPRNLTSSGEWFRSGVADNAASPKLPNGTILLAWNPATKQAAVLRINNAGPYWGNRTLDVSRGAAERLGFARQGVARLKVAVVHAPSRAEATYKKGRRYAAVPGPIGSFASFELASAAASRAMGAPTMPDTPPASTVAVASLEAPAAPAVISPPEPENEILATVAAESSTSGQDTPPPTLAQLAVASQPGLAASSPLDRPSPPSFGALGAFARTELPALQLLRLSPIAASPINTAEARPAGRPATAKSRSNRRATIVAAAEPRTAARTQIRPIKPNKAEPASTRPRRAQATAVAEARPSAAQQSAARAAQLRRSQDVDDEADEERPASTPRRMTTAAQPAQAWRAVRAPHDHIPVECRSWTYGCNLSPSATARASSSGSSRTRIATSASSNNE